ncbi:MAG TPA: MFS transporter [Thermomicrobiales bacterium]|nr:MFS transporter [Thermomicrobiales bacterium]
MATVEQRVDQADDTDVARRREISLRAMVPLCLATFAGIVNLIAPTPFLDELAADLDSSVPLVGQAVSIALLTAAFVGLVAGPLADHAGHRKILLAGLICAGISALGSALATGYASFMAARAVGGFASSMTVGLGFGAAASLFEGPARRRALSMIGASISLGTALGPLALAGISGPAGWRGAFAAIAVVAAAGVVTLLALFPAQPSSDGRDFALRRLLDSYRPILSERAMVLLYAAWALRAICWMGCLSFLGALFSERHDFSTSEVGAVFLLAGGAYMSGSLTAGGRLGAFNLRVLSLFALLGMAAGFGALYALSLPAVTALVALGVTTFIAGISQTAILTLVAERTTGGPSTTMMLTEMVVSVGAALGGGLGGLLLGGGGFVAMGTGLPLAALLSAALISRASSPPRHVPVEPRPAQTA